MFRKFELNEQSPDPFALNVLAIESELLDALLTRTALQAAGINAQLALTETDAETICEFFTPDVVVACWDLEGIDGRSLVSRLRKLWPSLCYVPTVIVTDRKVNELTSMQLSREGLRWILQKPIAHASLPKFLKNLASAREHSSTRRPAMRVDFGTSLSQALMPAIH